VPEPKFWKALLATLLFSVPLSLVARALFHMGDLVWLISTVGGSLIIASIVHGRVVNDWRAQDKLHMQVFDRRTSVAPRVRVGRKRWP
jgi:hypothetical protein